MGEAARAPRAMVDTHCHLDALDFLDDVGDVLARGRAAFIRWFVTIGSGRGTESAPDAIAIAHTQPDVVACVGIHPLDAASATATVLDTLASFAEDRRVVGVGETGLDYRSAYARKDVQGHAFRSQIRLARDLGKPVIVHTRAAAADTLSILREERARDVGGVVHSLSDDGDFASAVLDLGFDISFSALPILDGAPDLLAVARSIPLDRLMIESNAPVLAPPPRRGQRCEPSDLVNIAEGLAAIIGLDPEELCARTYQNAVRLFGLDALGP